MRLFVAVNLPAAEHAALAATLHGLRARDLPVRWVEPDSLHITLKFLGEVAEARVGEVQAALARAAQGISAFEMRVGGAGTFPSPNRARVFWIGVAAPAELLRLQDQVENEIEPLGYAREKRAFSPHITIGRVQKDGRVARTDVDRIVVGVGYNATMAVTSVDLMRSHLNPRGARYDTIASAPLENG